MLPFRQSARGLPRTLSNDNFGIRQNSARLFATIQRISAANTTRLAQYMKTSTQLRTLWHHSFAGGSHKPNPRNATIRPYRPTNYFNTAKSGIAPSTATPSNLLPPIINPPSSPTTETYDDRGKAETFLSLFTTGALFLSFSSYASERGENRGLRKELKELKDNLKISENQREMDRGTWVRETKIEYPGGEITSVSERGVPKK